MASAFNDPTGTSITADSAQHYISIHDTGLFDSFATTDPDVFSNGSTTLFTGSPLYGISIDVAGTYAVFFNAFTISGGTAGHTISAYFDASDGSAPSFFQQGRTAAAALDTWDSGQAGVGPHLFVHEWHTVDTGQTPAVFVPWGRVSGGSDAVLSVQLMIVQLTPNVLAKL